MFLNRVNHDLPLFRLIGDSGLLMELGKTIDPELNSVIRAMSARLEDSPLPGIREIIPTYCALTLIYDPLAVEPDDLISELSALHAALDIQKLPPRETIELPVCYHSSLGPDLDYVARVNRLTPEKVVEIHTSPVYPIYMIGFTPGFPYLGGLSEKIHTPRLSTPRTCVPAGSVGIANNQTGIYPIDSPGGWQIIGQCPIRLFDPSRDPPVLLKAGGKLRFKAIPLDEFQRLKEAVR